MLISQYIDVCLFYIGEHNHIDQAITTTILERHFEELVASFQLALYHHYENEGRSLYQPHDMKAFAEKNSPGLYNMILNAITRDDARLKKNRGKNQEQRTVALLHILAYFR